MTMTRQIDSVMAVCWLALHTHVTDSSPCTCHDTGGDASDGKISLQHSRTRGDGRYIYYI